MLERIDMGRRHVGIVAEVVGRVEIHRRIASLRPAVEMEMVERIDVGRGHIGVGREIAVGVEQGVRIAPFVPAMALEVLERIDVCGANVRIVLEVIDVIEAICGDQFGRRSRLAAFLRAIV